MTISEREAILTALSAWIRQRPGLDYRDYGEMPAYRAECRRIAQDRRDALELLRAVSARSAITAKGLKLAFRAFMGRLSWTPSAKGGKLDYCTGQYWPTEYRAAACAVLRCALWDYWRAAIEAMPEVQRLGNDDGPTVRARILDTARREVSRGVYRRWFLDA